MRQTKVIHVHLVGKRLDYYFGSISAIFTVLTPDDVAATKEYLLHSGLSNCGLVVTKRAIIKASTLITCPRRADGSAEA